MTEERDKWILRHKMDRARKAVVGQGYTGVRVTERIEAFSVLAGHGLEAGIRTRSLKIIIKSAVLIGSLAVRNRVLNSSEADVIDNVAQGRKAYRLTNKKK